MYDIYTVKDGDTIESIASNYNVTPYIIYKLNNLAINSKINTNDKLIVPRVADSYFLYYTIKKGDSLYKIADKYGVDYKLLALINGIDVNDYIYPNQVISVPKSNISYYIVEEDDTIEDVSNKLGISVMDVINNNNKLYLVPEQLIIYKKK
mgnify:FL=1